MVIGQAKFHQSINFDECSDAIGKMADFYISMSQGHYEDVNAKVQQRFLSLDAEVGEESKIKIVLFTSAPKNGIRIDKLKRVAYFR